MPKKGSSVRCPKCWAKPGKPCTFYDRKTSQHLERTFAELDLLNAALEKLVPCENVGYGCDQLVEGGGLCGVCSFGRP